MAATVEDYSSIYNTIEIGLWSVCGVGCIVTGLRRSGSVRLRCWFAAVVFFLFAASDAVELQTGAWWRPWWLLVWKAVCLIAFFGLYLAHLRRTR
jgi:hypothetical protein